MIRFAASGGGHIAYEVLDSPSDEHLLVITDGFVPIDVMDAEPRLGRAFRRLASFRRVIRFDRRGVAASDPLPPDVEPLDAWVDDCVAVLDAVGVPCVAVFGSTETAIIAMALAARHPERVENLVLFGCSARMTRAPGYDIGAEGIGEYIEHTTRLDPPPDADVDDITIEFVAPSATGDPQFRRWWLDAGRRGSSPAVAQRLMHALVVADVRAELPSITARTLVVRRRDDPIVPSSHPRYVADHVPDADYVEVPGADNLWWVGDAGSLLDVVEAFLTGQPARPEPVTVATLLFTDLVGSTSRATELGDRAWGSTLDAHDAAVRRVLLRNRGRERKTTGDGFLASFDDPVSAVGAALEITNELRTLGLEVRCGVHRGEIEMRGDDIAGLAVHVAARIMGVAGAGETVVSEAVGEALADVGARLKRKGTFELKGLPGTWRLLAVASLPRE